MVKIVDHVPDRSVVKQIVCKNCGVKLEYLPIEVKSRSGTDYGGGPDGCTWIDCPKCEKTVIISRW